MVTVTDIYGNIEMITGFKLLKRFRSVSGEKTLAFLLLPTEQNAHSFPMVQEESIFDFNGDTYRIKQMSEKPKGQIYQKEGVALHTFFDLIDEYIYETYTGSMTFQAALQFVLGNYGYTWDIIDTFYAQDFENFGDSNPIDLFNELRKRYGAEFTINGTHLTFKQKIGNATDFQLRYKYNIKSIDRQVNTNNFSTYIKGFGKDGLTSEYISPLDEANGGPFKRKHAKPVRDERYETVEGLNERLKAEIKEVPDVSIPIDFVDMRRAGFPFDVPSAGDDIFLIYERMNLDLETRIMDIAEEFTEFSDYPIKTDVTLANFRNNMTDQFVGFSRTQKTVDGVMNGSKKIPYNALDDAVKRATEALQSAQTELEFTNGLIARDKNNPNFIVLLNSNGVGISRDGGTTFKEAITSEGFVLSAGAIGQLNANNIQIGAETTFESGYNPAEKETPTGAQNKANAAGQAVRDDLRLSAPLPTSITMNQDGFRATTPSDPNRYFQADYRGAFVKRGAIEIERDDGFVTMIGGKLNQDFNIQGSDPPCLVDATISGRFFVTTSGLTNGATCNLYTFVRTARYVIFQVALMSTLQNAQSTAFLVQSGNEGTWLSSVTTLSTDETVQNLVVDLGTPDGSVYAMRLQLKSYQTDNTACCRAIRYYQSDFLPV